MLIHRRPQSQSFPVLSLMLSRVGNLSTVSAQTNGHRNHGGKMTKLYWRECASRDVVAVRDSRHFQWQTTNPAQARAFSERRRKVSKQLDALNVVVADVPIEVLESLLARVNFPWASEIGKCARCQQPITPVTLK